MPINILPDVEKKVLEELSDPKVKGSCCHCGEGTNGTLSIEYNSNGLSCFGTHATQGVFICEDCKKLFDTFFTYGDRVDYKDRDEYLVTVAKTTPQ